MEILTTKYGQNLLVIDGFSFIKDKSGPQGKIYWKCIEFQKKAMSKTSSQ